MRRILIAVALLAAVLAAGPAARAQTPASAGQSTAQSQAAPTDAQTRRDLDLLISILRDDARRRALIERLEAERNAQPPASGAETASNGTAPPPESAPPSKSETVVLSLSQRVRDVSESALKLAASLAEFPQMVANAIADLRNPDVRSQRFDAFWRMIAALTAGLALEALASAVLSGVRRRFEASAPGTIVGRTAALFARALVEAAPVAVFVATALILLPALATPPRARLAAILLIYAHALVRSALILARILVAPGTPALRLVPASDETAEYLYIWIRRLAIVAIYGTAASNAANLLGLSSFARLAALKVVGTIVALLLIVFILQNRSAVAQAITRGGGEWLTGVRRPIADVWHILVILYVVGLFGVWLLNVPGGFEYLGRASVSTVVIVLGAWLLIAGMKRAVTGAFRLSPDINRRFPELEARANRYLPVLREALRAVVWLFAFLLALSAWGVDSLDWLSSRTGTQVMGSAIAIVVVVIVALVIWESFTLVLERYSTRLVAEGAGGARARTLLPLFRTTALIVLSVMAGLVVLTEVGVNITPLLAGAGVVGLAVGFGSQKLVQDVINGVFMLVENTLSVGDVVDLGGDHAGVVEAISIRTIRLRDLSGFVHTVPFSEVHTVKNMTRDFAQALFDVQVAYREDVDRVIEAIHATDAELRQDETLAQHLLAPLEMMGLDRFENSSVVVRARIATVAGKQWDVTRAFNRLLKRRFDQLGIEIPYPHRTIYFGEDTKHAAPPVRVQVEGGGKDRGGTGTN